MADFEGELLRRLDLTQATLRVAFVSELARANEKIREDPISAEILSRSADWVGSTELQNAVAKATGRSTRTVRDRLGELVAERALETRGSERKLEYRSTGLFQ